MDVQRSYIQQEVYVNQPFDCINPSFPIHAFNLKNALYGLKQAARAWYDYLSKFLLENSFKKGKVDITPS